MDSLHIEETNDGVLFVVKVVPGSSRTAVGGCLNGAFKVKVAAAPERGKANENLVAFLAKLLGIKPKHVQIVSGLRNPFKQIKVTGISASDLRVKLRKG